MSDTFVTDFETSYRRMVTLELLTKCAGDLVFAHDGKTGGCAVDFLNQRDAMEREAAQLRYTVGTMVKANASNPRSADLEPIKTHATRDGVEDALSIVKTELREYPAEIQQQVIAQIRDTSKTLAASPSHHQRWVSRINELKPQPTKGKVYSDFSAPVSRG
jgi:hypothetical protein